MRVSGPHNPLIDANIQPLGQQIGQDFGNSRLNSTISQVQSMAAGTSGGNHDPQAAYSSLSRNFDDSINAGMANLSLNDQHPQTSTHRAINRNGPPPASTSQFKSQSSSSVGGSADDHRNRVDEETLDSEETHEQISTAAKSTVVSSGKSSYRFEFLIVCS